MELDKIKLKTVSQLNDAEKSYLNEHISELNDEDKEAYAPILNVDDSASAGDAGSGDNGEGGDAAAAGQDDGAGGAGSGGESAGGADAGAHPPTPPTYSFKNEDEAREFVRKVQKEEADAKQRAIDAAKTPEDKKYVEDNWRPKTWNEGLKKAVEIAKKEIRDEEEQKRIKANFDEYDRQWKELSTEKNIPALTTLEGRKVHAQVIGIMQGFGLSTFKEGYAKWEKLSNAEKAEAGTSSGGGKEPSPSEAAAVLARAKAEKTAAQKRAAGKIGGQNAGAGAVKGSASLKPSMEDIRGKSITKLIKEGLQSS